MALTDNLRPRGEIDPGVRTKGKDEAFQKLEELRSNDDFHGKTLDELALRLDWSKNHIRSVLKEYYVEESETEETEPEPQEEPEAETIEETFTLEIAIPEGVDRDSFLRGYLAGYLDR